MDAPTLFSQVPNIAYVGVIIPLAGMSIGALAIWTEHQRKQKALEVLKAYAESGKEPPASVLDSIAQVTSVTPPSKTLNPNDPRTGWQRFAFFGVMGVGFGVAAAWFSQGGAAGWPITLGLGIASFVLVALAASSLVMALTAPRANGG